MLRRLLIAGLAAALLASCSGGDDEGSSPTTTPFIFDGPTTTLLPTTPVVARLLSPEPASVQGAGGRGMVVALKFSAKDPTVLPAEFRLGGALPAPAPAARPGHNPAFPGLVVGLSSTGSALGGPSVNLANLFQVVSPALQLDGSREVSALWTNSAVDFGTDIDTVLTAYVVAGTAPDTIPPSQANIDVLSNTIEVTFHIGGAGGSTAVGPADATSTTSSTRPGGTATTAPGATTTSTRPTATTAVAPATTTTAPPATTTTRPATTTTNPNPLCSLLPSSC
ncbi:MAG TPA: hypothetical protein VM388_13500 [Acidimicrobiales bacterium]|nr:hypothetical protein [Acidimicrobiales bacterium]